MNSGSMNTSPTDSPTKSTDQLLVPSPIITKRTRSISTSKRALDYPESIGTIKFFCREKGHGFIRSEESSADIFVHISDIDGEYVPIAGDKVKYRLCPIPPKMEDFQAVHVNIVNYVPEVHLKWDGSS